MPDEEQNMVMHTSAGNLTHLGGDGGGHRADGGEETAEFDGQHGRVTCHHHDGHRLADGASDAKHDRGQHT